MKKHFHNKLNKIYAVLAQKSILKVLLLLLTVLFITSFINTLFNYHKSVQDKAESAYGANSTDYTFASAHNGEKVKLLAAAIKGENINLYSIGYGEEGGAVLTKFVLEIKGRSKNFNWANIKNPLYYPKLFYKDINNDSEKELVVVNTVESYTVLKQEVHIIDVSSLNEIKANISIDALIESKLDYKEEVNSSAIIKLMFPGKTFTEKNGIFIEKSEFPNELTVESVEKGSFVSKDDEQYLIMVKQTGAPHAIGLENRFVAVVDRSKAKLLSSVKEFNADHGQIITYKGKELSFVYFAGANTYGGYTYSLDNSAIGLWKPGEEWIRVWQEDQNFWQDNVSMAAKDDIYIYSRKNFINNPHETVEYAWELKAVLKWDADKETFIPEM